MLKLKHEEEMDWKKQTEGLLQIESEKKWELFESAVQARIQNR